MIGHTSSYAVNPLFFSIRNSQTICASYKKFKHYGCNKNNLKNLFRDLKGFSQGHVGTKSYKAYWHQALAGLYEQGVEEAPLLSMGDNLAQRNGVLRAG